ncbi:CynX/NimT family MFS transporter [Acinetobacter sp.]|uniref:MFS transporter n=1 Tax=Acinetobacter sp. TaxID=472 RepID=UPI00388F386F
MNSAHWLSKDLWIIAAGFVAAMHIGKLPPTISLLQAELGISLVQASFLLSLVQVAGMCMALLLGSYTAKIGLKSCVLLGLSLLTIASCIGGFVQTFSSLLALRVMEGFGFLLITLSGPAFIRQLVPVDHLQAKMGLWSAYMGGGMGIGLLCTPLLLNSIGWQGVWICYGLLSLSLACVIYSIIPKAQANTQPVEIFNLIQLTLKHPPAWILAIIFGVYAGQWFSLVSFLPSIYQQYQFSLALAGALTAIVAIANAIGTFVCGLLLQRGFRPQTLVQTGFANLILCALSFYLLHEFLPFSLQFILVLSFSLFGGFVAAVVFSQVLNFAAKPIAITSTIGLVLQCSATSQFLLPPLIASIVLSTGSWFWVGILMAILSLIGMFLIRILFRKTA